jgi:hypothetical protein
MYIDPKTVTSPKNKVRSVEVLFDKGPVDSSWSIAAVEYGDKLRFGIRWNGDEKESKKGVPLANAHPVWFILPEELDDAVRLKVEELKRSEADAMLEGYRQMAADEAQETEAEEWAEELIGDAY